MNPLRLGTLVLIALLSVFGLGHSHAADADFEKFKAQIEAQMNAMKAQYEKQIQGLEQRIQSLEGDNERLKRTAKVPGAANSNDVATLKQRVEELESSTAPEALAAARRASTNAMAIEEIQRKLHANATETRDIYRDTADWPFDLSKLYDPAAAPRVSRLPAFRASA
jgi:maltoporin